MDVDWTKPIEAVHEDGRVVSAHVEDKPIDDMDSVGVRRADKVYMHVKQDGTYYSVGYGDGWRIRNVQPAVAKPAEIDAALVERMVAALRLAADMGSMSHADDIDAAGEAARAIVAELPEPVDADLLEARKLACENSRWERNCDQWRATEEGRQDHIPMVRAALAGIKRGRALEREGK